MLRFKDRCILIHITGKGKIKRHGHEGRQCGPIFEEGRRNLLYLSISGKSGLNQTKVGKGPLPPI